MNPLTSQIVVGTIGELLVQIRLLQFNVQAAPPLKDSGNDLIAIRDNIMKTIQVKTTTKEKFVSGHFNSKRKYNILALVLLKTDNECKLDESKVYLIDRRYIAGEDRWKPKVILKNLAEFELNENRIDQLFSGAEESSIYQNDSFGFHH